MEAYKHVHETTFLSSGYNQSNGGPLSYKSADVWMAALSELYTSQVALGNNTCDNFRGAAFKSKMTSLKNMTATIQRETDADRGIDGLSNRYSDEEFLAINRHLLQSSGNNQQAAQHLRTHLDITLGHYYVLRGESRRMAELADFQIQRFPEAEGATPCDVLIFVLDRGKTNRWGKTQFMGTMRNRSIHLCPISALAQYLFWRWHCSGEAPPTFFDRRSWYRTKLLISSIKSTTQEISYGTQLEHINESFSIIGVESASKTQAMRGCAAREAEIHGINKDEIG